MSDRDARIDRLLLAQEGMIFAQDVVAALGGSTAA